MVTVKDLMVWLSGLNPDVNVVMSKDAEGNNFSPLSDFSLGFYEAETTWYGEFYGTDEEDGPADAVCLWPTN